MTSVSRGLVNTRAAGAVQEDDCTRAQLVLQVEQPKGKEGRAPTVE